MGVSHLKIKKNKSLFSMRRLKYLCFYRSWNNASYLTTHKSSSYYRM